MRTELVDHARFRWLARRKGALAICLALLTAEIGLSATTKPHTFTTTDVPGAGIGAGEGTFPIGRNASGAITGYYVDASDVNHGFVRTPNGTITEFDAPGGALEPARVPLPTA